METKESERLQKRLQEKRPWDDRCDSNLIVHLNVKCRPTKLLEDTIGGYIDYLGLDDGF